MTATQSPPPAAAILHRTFSERRPDLALRDEEPGDSDFIDRLFIANLAIAAALPPAMLAHQAAIRRQQYAPGDRPASRLIVTEGGRPIGRLAIDWDDEGRCNCVDIALLPDAQGAGIGRALLASWLTAVDDGDRPASLWVEPENAARRLYEGFGFVAATGEGEPSMMMIRPVRPTGDASPAPRR